MKSQREKLTNIKQTTLKLKYCIRNSRPWRKVNQKHKLSFEEALPTAEARVIRFKF